MAYPTPPVFIAFLDANPGRYKNNPEPDGYNPTNEINEELTRQPEIANPDPQGQTLLNLTIADLQILLSPLSLGRLSDTWWDNMRIYLSPGGPGGADGGGATRADAIATVDNAASRGNITADEATALTDKLNETEPDPNWSATILDDSDGIKEWNQGGFTYGYTNNALGR